MAEWEQHFCSDVEQDPRTRGRAYYVNKATNETRWLEPEEYHSFQLQLDVDLFHISREEIMDVLKPLRYLTRGESATAVRIHAEMTARGHTQDEADANLQLLDIGRAHDGDTLRIFGDYPRDVLAGTSPTFAFTLEVPEQLALTLRTHNGGVATAGTAAPGGGEFCTNCTAGYFSSAE